MVYIDVLAEDIGDGEYPYYKKYHNWKQVMIGANSLIMLGVTIGSCVVVGNCDN